MLIKKTATQRSTFNFFFFFTTKLTYDVPHVKLSVVKLNVCFAKPILSILNQIKIKNTII